MSVEGVNHLTRGIQRNAEKGGSLTTLNIMMNIINLACSQGLFVPTVLSAECLRKIYVESSLTAFRYLCYVTLCILSSTCVDTCEKIRRQQAAPLNAHWLLLL